MTDAPQEPQEPKKPEIPEIPSAVVVPKRRWAISLVWLVPMVVALIGGWIALNAIRDRGPTITINFKTGEGIEAGKTRIKYKNVDIGQVKSVVLSRDRSHVIVRPSFPHRQKIFSLRTPASGWCDRASPEAASPALPPCCPAPTSA